MKHHVLEVWGDFACFTRPEMKVERVSYDVITPSAARAIFEAILWRPAIHWQIDQIDVLAPVRWINLRRNEVASKVPVNGVRKAMKEGSGQLALAIEDDRQQRAGLFLRDVRYRLHGRFELTDRAGVSDNAGKFSEMFRRRADAGQCFNQPYLGCREFSCGFRPVDDTAPAVASIEDTRDLGFMLYDIDFTTDPPQPQFFKARLEHGTLRVPPLGSADVVR